MSDSLEELLISSRKPAEFLFALAPSPVLPLEAQLQALQDYDLSFLELRGVNGRDSLELTNEELKQIETALTNQNIRVSAVGSSLGFVPLANTEETERQRFLRVLEIADWMGCSYVKISGFLKATDINSKEALAQIVRRLENWTGEAALYGLILVLENHPMTWADNPEDCAHIIKEVGSSNLRCAFNPANFVAAGFSPFDDAYADLASQLTYLQVNDALPGKDNLVPAFTGAGQLEEVIGELHQVRYAGYVGFDWDGQDITLALNAFKDLQQRLG